MSKKSSKKSSAKGSADASKTAPRSSSKSVQRSPPDVLTDKPSQRSTTANTPTLNVEEFIRRHLRNPHGAIEYTEQELLELFDMAIDRLRHERPLLKVHPPVTIFGDIHGHYKCLLELMALANFPPSSAEGHSTFVFLGNYGTRGNLGVECVVLLLALKVYLPKSMCMLRGNHDCAEFGELFGLKKALEDRAGTNPQLWEKVCRALITHCAVQLCRVFDCLPLAATIGDKVICVHGGVSKELLSIDSLSRVRHLPSENRMSKSGFMGDLLWSCPQDVRGFAAVDGEPTTTLFGADTVSTFLKQNNLLLMVRGRQIVNRGHLHWPSKKCVTLFSAVNYCGDFSNVSVMLTFDKDMKAQMIEYELPMTDGPSPTNLISEISTDTQTFVHKLNKLD